VPYFPPPSTTIGNTGVTAGTYGDSTHVGQFTVQADGRITAASDISITNSGGSLRGFAIFDASSGSIASLSTSGVITNVTRTGTGRYTITLTGVSGVAPNYAVAITGIDNNTYSIVGYLAGTRADITDSSFKVITLNIGAQAVVDPVWVSIMISY
jgi:hypothetical protein